MLIALSFLIPRRLLKGREKSFKINDLARQLEQNVNKLERGLEQNVNKIRTQV